MAAGLQVVGSVLLVDRTGKGGVHQYSHGLASALSARARSVTLLTTTMREVVPSPGGTFRVVNRLRWRTGGSRWSVLRLELVNLAIVLGVVIATRSRTVLFQLVHPAMTDQWAVPLLRLLGVEVVLTCHNLGHHERDGRIDAHGLSAYRRADAIVTLSAAERSKLLTAAPELAPRVSVVPHGNLRFLVGEPLLQAEARRSLDLAPEGRLILFFGYFRRYKGIDVLLDALAILRDRGVAFGAVLAGAAEEDAAAAVHAQVARHGLGDRVVLRRGYVEGSETGRYFAASDVVVLPYREATQSGVIQMAYAHGRPVVATDVGGLAEDVIPGETGDICPPEDPEALAECLAGLLDDPTELERRQRLLVESPPRRHEWDELACAYCEVIAGIHSVPADAGTADPVVVFVSDVHWDGLWFGAQHLGSRLAERGFRVLFLDVPVSVASPLKDRSRWGQLRRRFRRISPTLAVDVLVGVPPQDARVMRAVNAYVFARRIRRVLGRMDWPEPSIVIGRHPYSGRLAPLFPDALFVANLSDASWFADEAETSLRLTRARAAVCVSPPLVSSAEAAGIRSVLHLAQGVDAGGVAASAAGGPPAELARMPGPRIGALGNLTSRIDLALVEEIVRARPEWQFVFVGGAMAFSRDLAELPVNVHANVHQFPACDPKDVGSRLSGFDVAWVPYTWSEFNVASNPLKMWEYLAAGLPAVGPDFPALSAASAVATLLPEGADAAAWIDALEQALKEDDPTRRQARQDFAKANDWNTRADALAGFLRELLRDQGC